MSLSPLVRVLGVAAVVVTIAATTSRHGGDAADTVDQTAVVDQVLDGDTIAVSDRDGHRLGRVRLLGIDAPELAHDGRRAQCWAGEATSALRHLTPVGTVVTLQRDPGQDDRDSYGRLLRYVVLRDQDVQRELLSVGSVRPRTSRPALKRQSAYVVAASDAYDARRGLWGTCPDHHTLKPERR